MPKQVYLAYLVKDNADEPTNFHSFQRISLTLKSLWVYIDNSCQAVKEADSSQSIVLINPY
jgi:hypothetical protein